MSRRAGNGTYSLYWDKKKKTYQVLSTELILGVGQVLQFEGELEGGKDGVGGGEGDEGRGGEGPVGVNAGSGVAQRVLLGRLDALRTPTPVTWEDGARETKHLICCTFGRNLIFSFYIHFSLTQKIRSSM